MWKPPRLRPPKVHDFLHILGLVYFIAFISFGTQAMGLIGSHGILPVQEYFSELRRSAGIRAFWEAPCLLWLNASDWALTALWVAGAISALAAVLGPWPRV